MLNKINTEVNKFNKSFLALSIHKKWNDFSIPDSSTNGWIVCNIIMLINLIL